MWEVTRSTLARTRSRGKDRVAFLESVVVADVAEMKASEAKLTLLTNEQGGIIDDAVLTNHGEEMCVCVGMWLCVCACVWQGDVRVCEHMGVLV